jgi:hypothetical protein
MKFLLSEEKYKYLKEGVQEFLDEILIEYRQLKNNGELHYSSDYTISNLRRIILEDIFNRNGKKIMSIVIDMNREVNFDEDVMYDILSSLKNRWGGVEVEIKIKNRK